MPQPSDPDPRACLIREDCPVADCCAPLRPAICAQIAERHAAKLTVCDILESIADALPDVFDRNMCLWAAANLLPAVRAAQDFEEQVVFPQFGSTGGHHASLKRLRAEHVEDLALAEELTEPLMRLGHGDRSENAEALGYMLRAFFEAVRRHVAFEREHVLPLVRASSGDEAYR